MENNKKVFKSGTKSPSFVQCRFEKGRSCKVFYVPEELAVRGKNYILRIDKKDSEWFLIEVGQKTSLDVVKNMGYEYTYPKLVG